MTKKIFTVLFFFLITSLYIPSIIGRINLSVLKQAYKIFHATPGAQKVFNNVNSSRNYHNIKGYYYELRKAVKIHNKKKEKVVEFGFRLQFPDNKKRREIDIFTLSLNKEECLKEGCFIECKCINWDKASVKKLKKQFIDQRDLTRHYNRMNNTNIKYVVCSKNPIPKRWKTWFNNKNIAFKETY